MIKDKFGTWRLILILFIVAYLFFLLLNLGYMSVQWDEMPHLYGGLLLTRGQTQNYLSTYGYYPPLYDIFTSGFLQIFGTNATSGRLAAVTFSLLSIWAVFEFTNQAYGPKAALLASILLGTMPGFFWVSRVAMLETILIFFFSLASLFFFSWIGSRNDKLLILSGLALGFGFLAKYQVLVAGIIMIVSLLFCCKNRLRTSFKKFLIVPLVALLVIVPWIAVLYQTNGSSRFGELLYVMGEGSQDRLAYSDRFPLPVFYLIELTWPFPDIPVHPISLPVYVLGLLGLGVMAYRRKTGDKFLLICFAVVYIFFTVIPNKQWRYVTPLFPVLAMSAASFVLFLYGKVSAFRPEQTRLNRERIRKIAAALCIVLAAAVIAYSSYDAYQMTARDQIHIPIEETANYLASHMNLNDSAAIVCAYNLLNQDMFRFYLPANMSPTQIWQYPELAVDAFKPDFNITEFVSLCEQRNVKYVILYDYGADTPFYNTTLTYSNVTQLLFDSGRFGYTGDEPFFGNMPYRTFLVGFHT